jgi:branched-chain amino acid transport system permease protein
VVLMSVLGGTRHWAGPAVGAAAITGLLYAFTAGNYAVAGKAAVGCVLVAVILFMPNGILGFRWRPSFTRVRRDDGVRAAGPSVDPDVRRDDGVPAAQQAVDASAAHRSDRPKPLLEVHNLSKAFKGVQALDGVSLQVRDGEILGLLGPNGSGKSTFINVVSGHHAPSSGEIAFNGRALTGLAAHRIAGAGIARTYQIPRPFAHMSVLHNVALVAMFGAAALPQPQAIREAWKWLEFTGLHDKADALPDDLNLHQRKFLELARALAARPRLVLLDEVLSGPPRSTRRSRSSAEFASRARRSCSSSM